MSKRVLLIGIAGLLSMSRPAAAFCGFYVNGAGSEMFNDATQVVLMRSGTRTVLSMQNNYKGPPEQFALVIPVPVVLKKEDVKTLQREVFAKVDVMGAPRLVEYWEIDPCRPDYDDDEGGRPGRAPLKMAKPDDTRTGGGYGVKIEA